LIVRGKGGRGPAGLGLPKVDATKPNFMSWEGGMARRSLLPLDPKDESARQGPKITYFDSFVKKKERTKNRENQVSRAREADFFADGRSGKGANTLVERATGAALQRRPGKRVFSD